MRELAVDVAVLEPESDRVVIACLLLDAASQVVGDGVVGAHAPSGGAGAVLWQPGLTGGRGWISLSLDHVPADVARLAIVIGSEDVALAGLRRGQVRVSAASTPIVSYSFAGGDFAAERAIIAVEAYRKDGWRIAAVGQGFDRGLTGLLAAHGAGPIAAPAALPLPPPPTPAAPPVVPVPTPGIPLPSRPEPAPDLQGEWIDALHTQIVDGDLPGALRKLLALAEQGHVLSMGSAARVAHQMGDLATARRWLERAAELGDAEAAHDRAALAVDDDDLVQAERWFQVSVDGGHAAGHAGLAHVAQAQGDLVAAKRHAQRGVEADDPRSQFQLGNLLRAEDPAAVHLFAPLWERAAEAGESLAMFNMGVLRFQQGDRYGAREWLVRARQAGLVSADTFLEQNGLDR